MEFELYTQKSVKECMTAIKERLQSKQGLEGAAEKDGRFWLAIRSPVVLGIQRRTHLDAQCERSGSTTVIRGAVSHGVPPKNAAAVVGVAVLIGAIILLNGEGVLGILAIVIGLALYIPLVGDARNSETLLKEVKRTLNAKDAPLKA